MVEVQPARNRQKSLPKTSYPILQAQVPSHLTESLVSTISKEVSALSGKWDLIGHGFAIAELSRMRLPRQASKPSSVLSLQFALKRMTSFAEQHMQYA